jgi:hypothetical protein
MSGSAELTIDRISGKYRTGVQAYVQTVNHTFDIKDERLPKVHRTFERKDQTLARMFNGSIRTFILATSSFFGNTW